MGKFTKLEICSDMDILVCFDVPSAHPSVQRNGPEVYWAKFCGLGMKAN